MIAVLMKDLREMWAAPITLAAIAFVSCLLLGLAAALPLPDRNVRIGVAPVTASCQPLAAPVASAAAAAPQAPAAADVAPGPVELGAPGCPFPDRDTLVHGIRDLTGVQYQPIEPGSSETPWAHAPADRWVESEAWDMMDRERLDVLFVWYPTMLRQDDIAVPNTSLDWMQTYGAEAGGVWMAYTQSLSATHAAQMRFGVRQAQASATHIANARRNADSYAAPSAGFADAFTEFAPLLVGLEYRKKLDAFTRTWVSDRDSVQTTLEKAIKSYVDQATGGPLSEMKAALVRDALTNAYVDLPAEPANELFNRFRREMEGDAQDFAAPPPLPPLEAPAFAPGPAAPPAAVAPPAAFEPALPPTPEVLEPHEIDYFMRAVNPADQPSAKALLQGEHLPVITPFLLSERDGPPRSTSAWLVPGLVLIIACAVAFMLAAGATVREREHGTEHLLKAGRQWWRAGIGKSLAPAIAAFIILLMLMLTGQVFFGFQVKAGWALALVCAALALAAASFQGVAVGSLLRNQSAALAISGGYLICLILFGDILIPMDAAAWPTAWLSQALPTRMFSEDWTDWMTWGVPMRLQILAGLAVLVLASLASLLGAVLLRHRSV